MNISFLGASGTVTGSKFLIKKGRTSVLLDCGLYQGAKELEEKNWAEFNVDPHKINAVLLSHAHLDHSGYLPKLCKDGFHGNIYATSGTQALAEIILKDSAQIQMYDAKKVAERTPGSSKAVPLYRDADANRALGLFKVRAWGEWFDVGPLKAKFQSAGHILGASSVYLEAFGKTILYSGDLGRDNDVLIGPPEPRQAADIVLLESTYGNRLHKKIDPEAELIRMLKRTKERKSKVLIPAFAVGRSQALMVHFHNIFSRHHNLKIPIYVHSPMTTSVSNLYENFLGIHNLSKDQCKEVFADLRFLRYPRELESLEKQDGPYILMSASGMLEGGPVLSHLKKMAGDSNNILIIAGYQAEETRGREIVNGVKSVEIEGESVAIKMEVMNMDFFSAHADQAALVNWLVECESVPEKVILIHGEEDAREGLKEKILEDKRYADMPVELPLERDILSLGES